VVIEATRAVSLAEFLVAEQGDVGGLAARWPSVDFDSAIEAP
jgi:hypothetical protein